MKCVKRTKSSRVVGRFLKGSREIDIFENNVQNFWAKVEKSDSCWNWIAGKTKQGYGKIQVGRVWFLASRFSYMLHNGLLPKDKPFVLHSCDNPSCVNPAHLWAGTQLDNINDMVSKGRAATGIRSGAHTHPEKWKRGEENSSSKLTSSQVIEMRKRRDEGNATIMALCKDYGVCKRTVALILKREKWKHV